MKKKIFVSIILYVFLFSNVVAYAATPDEVGLYVASYAKNLCENYTIHYVCDNTTIGTTGYFNSSNTDYTSECVSFTRRCYKDSVNFSNSIPVPSSNNGVNDSPADTQAGYSGSDFELIAVDDLSQAQPGDIIENYHHDMVYVGTVNGVDNVIANNGYNTSRDGLANGLVTMDEYYQDSPHHYRIWRITKEAAESLGDASTFDAGGDLLSGVKKKKNSANGSEMSNFYYNGIPDGKYSVSKSFFSVLIESLGQIMDWIIGLLTMMVRMVFVGWAAIIEWVINSAVKGLTGGGNMNSVPVTATEVQSGDNITIEKIIFNKIGIFDVNFFNFNDEDPNLNPQTNP